MEYHIHFSSNPQELSQLILTDNNETDNGSKMVLGTTIHKIGRKEVKNNPEKPHIILYQYNIIKVYILLHPKQPLTSETNIIAYFLTVDSLYQLNTNKIIF